MTVRRALALDLALAAALAASLLGLLRSNDLHGLISVALVGAVGAHIAAHRRWVVRAVARLPRSRSPRVGRDLTVATALACVFLPLGVTGGLLLSTVDRGDDLHAITGWLFVGLVTVHVAVHARWLRRAAAFRPRS